MPPPTHRWMIVVDDGEGPDGEREVEVAVRMDDAQRTHRRPAADRLQLAAIWSMAAIFGAPVTEPPGNIAASSSGSVSARPHAARHARHEVLDAGHRARGHQLRPGDAARFADPAQVVALQVHDHHVLGGVLGRCPQLGAGHPVAGCP